MLPSSYCIIVLAYLVSKIPPQPPLLEPSHLLGASCSGAGLARPRRPPWPQHEWAQSSSGVVALEMEENLSSPVMQKSDSEETARLQSFVKFEKVQGKEVGRCKDYGTSESM